MSFIKDEQTLDDLNLLGKYRAGSIYGLFNKVKTRGGERLLDEMFRRPLTEPLSINERSGVFLYMQGRALVFPFSGEAFGIVEDYLGMGGERNVVMNVLAVFRRRVLEVVVKDEGYGKMRRCVRAAVDLVKTCRDFFGQFDEEEVPAPLGGMLMAVRKILHDRRLDGIGEAGGLFGLARVHHLFVVVLREEMQLLCDTICYIDVYIAVSKVAAERGLFYARAVPEEEYVFDATDLRHPGLDQAVGNRVSFSRDFNVLFLTGANMAGKSTLMKSLGIALYLAHMGFPLAARDMVFSVKEGIYSSINVPDNLSLGYSHFYAEVQRVRTIAEVVARSKSLLVIFDELFKGTNVKDAYDATLAVTAAMARYGNCWFIISTHITEVGEALGMGHDNIRFSYLPTVMEGTRPRYTYVLQKGISEDRHGMTILANEGVLEMIR